MQAIEDAKEKCRKLTRLMADPGATAGEKRVARTMRRKILTRHGLKLADLRSTDPEEPLLANLERSYYRAPRSGAELIQAFAVMFARALRHALTVRGVNFRK